MVSERPILELCDVSRSFGGINAVTGLSFHVNQGEVLGLIGPNGAGKTTVFNIISGLIHPSSGQIKLNGANIHGLRPDQVCRKGIARTFQASSFIPGMTVYQNVLMAASFRPNEKRKKLSSRELTDATLKRTGLADVADDSTDSLNVSQQKRLEIARAVASEPSVIMTDEIVAGLNPAETNGILQILAELSRSGMTLIFVEHDVRAVLSVSTRLVVLAQGSLLKEGPPQEVVRSPEVIRVYLGSRYAEGK